MKQTGQAGTNDGQNQTATGNLLDGADANKQDENVQAKADDPAAAMAAATAGIGNGSADDLKKQQKKKEPKRQVTFEYGVGDGVTITANQCKGDVTRMLVDKDRMLYEVRYTDANYMIHDLWFRSEEIEPAR